MYTTDLKWTSLLFEILNLNMSRRHSWVPLVYHFNQNQSRTWWTMYSAVLSLHGFRVGGSGSGVSMLVEGCMRIRSAAEPTGVIVEDGGWTYRLYIKTGWDSFQRARNEKEVRRRRFLTNIQKDFWTLSTFYFPPRYFLPWLLSFQ